MSRPTWVASGTLVQTIPWRASISDRVANCRPVMRSICAKSTDVAKENSTMMTNRFFTGLFVTQRFHRIEPRGAIRGKKGEDAANQKCAEANDSHVARDNFGGQS